MACMQYAMEAAPKQYCIMDNTQYNKTQRVSIKSKANAELVSCERFLRKETNHSFLSAKQVGTNCVVSRSLLNTTSVIVPCIVSYCIHGSSSQSFRCSLFNNNIKVAMRKIWPNRPFLNYMEVTYFFNCNPSNKQNT